MIDLDERGRLSSGRWKGTPVGRVPLSYLFWLLDADTADADGVSTRLADAVLDRLAPAFVAMAARHGRRFTETGMPNRGADCGKPGGSAGTPADSHQTPPGARSAGEVGDDRFF